MLLWALILGKGYKMAVEMSTERLSHRDHISFYSLLVPKRAKWRPGSLSYQELSEGKEAMGNPQQDQRGDQGLDPRRAGTGNPM